MSFMIITGSAGLPMYSTVVVGKLPFCFNIFKDFQFPRIFSISITEVSLTVFQRHDRITYKVSSISVETVGRYNVIRKLCNRPR